METDIELEGAVESIEERAERKRTAENIEARVSKARTKANSVNDDLQTLEALLRDLTYYRQVLDGVVNPNREPRSVDDALDDARAAVREDGSAFVDRLVGSVEESSDRDVSAATERIDDAIDSVDAAIEDVKGSLREHRSKWEANISSARDLQHLLGTANDDFLDTVEWIEELVTDKVWDPSNNADVVCREWENATAQWREHQDLQDLSAYQETHDLSDGTIDALRKLDTQSTLTLEQVDLAALEEMKAIEDLSEAVELQI